MKKNIEIKTKRMKYEITITMRIIMYLSGQEKEIKGKNLWQPEWNISKENDDVFPSFVYLVDKEVCIIQILFFTIS